MDVIIFSGQSNMQGQTEALPSPNEPVEGAFEYKYEDDVLAPLMHPCGEDLGASPDDPSGRLLERAVDGHGSLIPDFCREYVRLTNRRVCAVHTAMGATTVAEWQKDGDGRARALRRAP